jgi:hypothetical protein
MAQQRPFDKQNWQGRNFQSFGPKFRIDIANPQMGLNGSDIYNLYGVTDNGDVSLIGSTEGGMLHIYNDQTIEIVAGEKSKTTGVDIIITGKNGDIWITAEKNGQVRIRGAKVTIDADESIDLVAGKNINLKAGNTINLKSNIANCDALEGNLPPIPKTFGGITFDGTFVGTDLIKSVFGGGG